MTELLETDVLVLGSGIAGCVAALRLAQGGAQVTLVTRATAPEDTNTNWAQGGIIYKGEGDSADLLVEDLMRASVYFGNPAAMQILAHEGPSLVEEVLIGQVNVPFDRTAEGFLSIVLEGAHSSPRIIHAADATGAAIQIALLNHLRRYPNIRLLTGHTAIDLLTPQHHSRNPLALYAPSSCVGAYLFDQQSGQVVRCLARKTVLATGGLGQIFSHTSNPKGSRGDGLAMAARAGARVINAEFVQFHPTTLHVQGAPNHLISEAVRGEGARLTQADGTPFMQKYSPEWKDLAPRDVVSRSIHQEMVKYDLPCVYLDLRSYIAPEAIRHHFPTIMKTCAAYGIDIARDLVPVTPAAHYFCGGVWVDALGQTTIGDLYAIGEVSCTGPTGSPARRCWRGWCGGCVRPITFWPRCPTKRGSIRPKFPPGTTPASTILIPS
jgi:L-aspartate oxidase